MNRRGREMKKSFLFCACLLFSCYAIFAVGGGAETDIQIDESYKVSILDDKGESPVSKETEFNWIIKENRTYTLKLRVKNISDYYYNGKLHVEIAPEGRQIIHCIKEFDLQLASKATKTLTFTFSYDELKEFAVVRRYFLNIIVFDTRRGFG